MKIGMMEYLRLTRALNASQSLVRGDSAIAALAFDAGYESLSTFYRDFEAYFGLSPRRFRLKTKRLRTAAAPA